MGCKFYKRVLCMLLSGVLFVTVANTSYALKADKSAAVATEESIELKEVHTTDEGDVIIELEDKNTKTEQEPKTCVTVCSAKIVRTFEVATVLMKIISSMAVYGGAAKIISELFSENKVLYFVCAGVFIGVVEPIVKKIYNVAKDNAKEDKKTE